MLTMFRVAELDQAQLRRLAQDAGARVTVVNKSGLVLCDSEGNPATMENHAQRPEFTAALAGAVGADMRTSNTIGVTSMYLAVPAGDGALRLAVPMKDV